jgi:Domain of unknown function (DUF1876)
MSTTKRWTAEILIDEEDDGTTRAVARLDTSDDAHVHGHGTWRRTGDAHDAAMGDELAVATALSQVAAKLSIRAAGDANESRLRLVAHG